MKDILMPRLGLTMEEGTVVEWRIAENDHFEKGDIIVEISSDKAISEVEASFSGKLVQIIVQEDEICKVGEPIAKAEIN